MIAAVRKIDRAIAEKLGCPICRTVVKELPDQMAFYISPGDHIIGKHELNEMRKNGVEIP